MISGRFPTRAIMADNLVDYIERFSPNVRDVFDGFRMADLISDLGKNTRLDLIVKQFAGVDWPTQLGCTAASSRSSESMTSRSRTAG